LETIMSKTKTFDFRRIQVIAGQIKQRVTEYTFSNGRQFTRPREAPGSTYGWVKRRENEGDE